MSSVSQLVTGQVNRSTLITFFSGTTEGKTRVDGVLNIEQKIGLILDRTPFHPVDPWWPDQPADRGTLTVGDETFTVNDCQVFAVNKETGAIRAAQEVKKAEKTLWHYVVVHFIKAQESDIDSFVGAEVIARVDRAYRRALSLHHSASHLAALALNAATKDLWKKPYTNDSLGAPNIDQAAIESSSIFADHTEECYRFGRTLGRQLKIDEVLAQVGSIEHAVNAQLKAWISQPGEMKVLAADESWDTMRRWQCLLPEGKVEIPCGGTHVSNLGEFAEITYRLKAEATGGDKRMKAIITAQAKDDISG